MKKQSILTIVTLLAIFLMSSCNSFEAKEVKLNSQNDSLNYTLGLTNGNGIKEYYLQKDSSDKAIKVLMDAMDEAFNSKASGDEMYKLGLQVGSSFKQQKSQGLMGDSALVFNVKLVKQGLVNALNDYNEGMSAPEAEQYINKVMSELQAKKMGAQQAPMQQMPAEEENYPEEEAN